MDNINTGFVEGSRKSRDSPIAFTSASTICMWPAHLFQLEPCSFALLRNWFTSYDEHVLRHVHKLQNGLKSVGAKCKPELSSLLGMDVQTCIFHIDLCTHVRHPWAHLRLGFGSPRTCLCSIPLPTPIDSMIVWTVYQFSEAQGISTSAVLQPHHPSRTIHTRGHFDQRKTGGVDDVEPR